MKKAMTYIPLLVLLLPAILLAGPTFHNSKAFIKASENDKSVKKEMDDYLDLTKKMLTDAELTDGLTYLRLSDCLAGRDDGEKLKSFRKAILQDIEENNMTTAYKDSQAIVL